MTSSPSRTTSAPMVAGITPPPARCRWSPPRPPSGITSTTRGSAGSPPGRSSARIATSSSSSGAGRRGGGRSTGSPRRGPRSGPTWCRRGTPKCSTSTLAARPVVATLTTPAPSARAMPSRPSRGPVTPTCSRCGRRRSARGRCRTPSIPCGRASSSCCGIGRSGRISCSKSLTKTHTEATTCWVSPCSLARTSTRGAWTPPSRWRSPTQAGPPRRACGSSSRWSRRRPPRTRGSKRRPRRTPA
mmetsp:Transcript_13917/g.39754  ORF Transcript_13917/g.39754 Transcript_13917/m.39754 type:complete len:244 (-) Transcript_13917:215-946(-)